MQWRDKMIDRQQVYDKFNGLCGYSGTPLEDNWQIDHVIPKSKSHFLKNDIDNINNLIPCQRIINHYKRQLLIDDCYNTRWNFRYRISILHKKLKALPKNPRAEKSIKRKEYLLKVASYFGITPDKPFSGVFYFETFNAREKVKLGKNGRIQTKTDRISKIM